MRLSSCLLQYFNQYLPQIKGTSEQSIKTYRQTFSLFLYFLGSYHSIKIKSLKIEHLSAEAILSFLHHLETHRKNTVQTVDCRDLIPSICHVILPLLYTGRV
ncbi:MAG: hypothetical protein DRH93_20660 [Deltaproteobacteria bacterium]|nr:MAG: hypothetical protein DRH93_20660 [Deltaproteobacteria bacterium]